MTHEEALNDVKNQLHDFMVSVESLNFLVEELLSENGTAYHGGTRNGDFERFAGMADVVR